MNNNEIISFILACFISFILIRIISKNTPKIPENPEKPGEVKKDYDDTIKYENDGDLNFKDSNQTNDDFNDSDYNFKYSDLNVSDYDDKCKKHYSFRILGPEKEIISKNNNKLNLLLKNYIDNDKLVHNIFLGNNCSKYITNLFSKIDNICDICHNKCNSIALKICNNTKFSDLKEKNLVLTSDEIRKFCIEDDLRRKIALDINRLKVTNYYHQV